LPLIFSGQLSVIKESLADVLIPFPNLSIKRAIRTKGQIYDMPRIIFEKVDREYPATVNGFLFWNLSDSYPEKTLSTEAVNSAIPSIIPTIETGTPRKVVRNIGTTG